MGPINQSAYELFDRWLEHWKRENAPLAHTDEEAAAAAAPPTQEAGISPMPASPVAAAPPLPRTPSDDDGLLVLQALTEHLVATNDPFGPQMGSTPCTRFASTAPTKPSAERQAGGAILRFPGRMLPTPRPSLTAPGAVPPKAVPTEERMAALTHPHVPDVVQIAPGHGLRLVLTAGLVASIACTALSALTAWVAPSDVTLGAVVALAVVTGLLGAARHRATHTTA